MSHMLVSLYTTLHSGIPLVTFIIRIRMVLNNVI